MRGAANKQSLGEGAAWAGQAGYGWDAAALKDAAAKVSSGDSRFDPTGTDRDCRIHATQHGKTVAQVLLRWSLQRG